MQTFVMLKLYQTLGIIVSGPLLDRKQAGSQVLVHYFLWAFKVEHFFPYCEPMQGIKAMYWLKQDNKNYVPV